MNTEEIVNLLKEEVKGLSEIEVAEASTPPTLLLDKKDLLNVCRHLYESDNTYFDMLSCITGIDNGEDPGTMEVVYHLYSITRGLSLALRVILDRPEPVVDSVTEIWKTADWHERETYDLFGIRFNNHPDLRRILLPNDWEGHPLRKDYKHQEYYHGVKVEY